MLKLIGPRTIVSLTRHALKTTEAVADTLGVGEQLETFQKGVGQLPAVGAAAGWVAERAGDIAPEPEALYKGEPGPYKVKTHRQTFVDESRGRKVPLNVYYPEKKGESKKEKSPVVVLSPGLGGNAATYRYLARHMASHGYLVLQPTHEGSNTKAMLTKTPLFSFTQKELIQRKADLSFSLDLLEGGKLPKEISATADTENTALVGHSFGALTAQAVAGVATRDKEGQEIDMAEERFDAFIAMSPYGDSVPTRILGMDPNTYSRVEQPIMYMSGDDDRTFTMGAGPKVHLTPYEGTASEDRYHVLVGGASHMDFAQVFGVADQNTADMTRSSSIAFLDAHLKGEDEARAYLADDLPRVARSRDSLASVPRS